MKRNIRALAVSLLITACAPAPAPLGFAAAFPAADANRSDAVSRKEFDEFWADHKIFKRFDRDGDSVLSLKEFAEAVGPKYEEHFVQFDINRNNSLTRVEVMAGWYDLFDADRTGTLSRAEFDNSVRALAVGL